MATHSQPPPPAPRLLTLRVNGEARPLVARPHDTLIEVLRGPLDLTGAKPACDMGDCGACAVLVEGAPTLSCITLAFEVEGLNIVTAEGLGSAQSPSILQRAFHAEGAAQCGYCTPGLVVAAHALLQSNPRPTGDEIRHALSGNLCRCTGYGPIFRAVRRAADALAEGDGPGPEGAEAEDG